MTKDERNVILNPCAEVLELAVRNGNPIIYGLEIKKKSDGGIYIKSLSGKGLVICGNIFSGNDDGGTIITISDP